MASKKKPIKRSAARKKDARPRAPRVARYPTRDALNDAVRAKCLEHVVERLRDADEKDAAEGRRGERTAVWQEHEASFLEQAVAYLDQTDVRLAREVAAKLRAALSAVVDFADAAHHKKGYEPAPFLRSFAEAVARPTLARFPVEWTHPFNFSHREELVAEFSHPGVWWWGADGPTSRDLAVLSLLAGSFPELRISVRNATVTQVIEAEERGINSVRNRMDIAWRRRPKKPRKKPLRRR